MRERALPEGHPDIADSLSNSGWALHDAGPVHPQSKACWAEWFEMQIKVLNEFRLHMGEPAHRKLIQEYATKFFRMDGGDGSLGVGPEGGLIGE
jgi:hypothetical protein